MNMILKSTVAVAALAGSALMFPAIATAGVDVSVGIGVPGVFYAPGAGYSPYDGPMYYDPIYFGGAWYHGPYRWRMENGQREFWVGGGWHRNEWRGGPIPGSLTFSNGGYYRGGRYDGFDGADRINARFPAERGGARPGQSNMAQDRGGMQPDRMDRPGPVQGDSKAGRPDKPQN
jgi:hypothetical protein